MTLISNDNDSIKEDEVFDAICFWRNFEVMINSKYIKTSKRVHEETICKKCGKIVHGSRNMLFH